MTTTTTEVIAHIAEMDIAEICNRSLINLLDGEIPNCTSREGLLLLSLLRSEFVALIDSVSPDCTIAEIGATGADLFEKCLPVYAYQTLQAVTDLVAYGEELPEGVAQQLDLIEIAEFSLFVVMQRFWDTLTEELALLNVFPN